MMRKSLLMVLIIALISLSALYAATEYVQSIPVSFSFDIVANYGFSGRKVFGLIYPDGIDEIYFTLDRKTGKIKTPDFWMYYQVFTPDLAKIRFSIGNLKSDGKQDLTFTSEDSYDVAEGTSPTKFCSDSNYLVLNKQFSSSDNSDFTPYFDSFDIVFVIDDASAIDWDSEYTATLMLTLEAI